MSVHVRFFAQARDAAGTQRATRPPGSTLGQLLDDLRVEYGEGFAAVLTTARVWVNGDEPAHGDETVVVDGDEVAVLPPVSGG